MKRQHDEVSYDTDDEDLIVANNIMDAKRQKLTGTVNLHLFFKAVAEGDLQLLKNLIVQEPLLLECVDIPFTSFLSSSGSLLPSSSVASIFFT